MKKINFILLFLTAMLCGKNSKAFTVQFTAGPANVCPGTSVTYGTDINVSPVDYVVWTCGGAGLFQAVPGSTGTGSGTTTFTESGLNNSTVIVNWTGANGTTSWVQATYHYTILGLHYTNSALQNVDFGLVTSPSAITSTPSICINSSSSFGISCPTPLPVGSSTGDATFPAVNSYVWSATNATISGSGSAVTLTCSATNNNPIVVSVKFYSSCGYYSGTFSKTISRSATVPAIPAFSSANKASDCVGVEVNWSTPGVADATSYTWSTTSSGVSLSPSGLNCGIIGNTTGGTSKIIKLKANNTCGSSALRSATYTVSNTGVCGPKSLIVDAAGKIIDQINVFPNPVADLLQINITNADAAKYEITMYDVLGKRMLVTSTSTEVGENKTMVDVSGLDNGVYFLTITDGKKIQNEKLIVAH